MIKKCIAKIVSKINLSEYETYTCMLEMVGGETEEIQTAAF